MMLLVATVAAFLCACGGASEPSRDVPVPSDATPLVAKARLNAQERTGIAASRWRVTEVTAKEWSDTALGCPQPGQVYSQVVTPGYLIRLESSGRKLEYHTSREDVVLCGS